MVSLNKIVVPFSMGLSLNTKNDPKQVQGSLINLENAFVQKTGELQKRNGYNQLSTDTFTTADAITDGVGLATFNNELVLLSSSELYSFAPGVNKWSEKGPAIFTEVETVAVESNTYIQTAGDLAITSGTVVYAWEDTRGGCWAQVTDLESGTPILSETQLSATGARPRCFGIGQYLFVFYYDTSTHHLTAVRFDTQSPGSFSAPVTVASNISTSKPFFDICLIGTSRMIFIYRTNSNQLTIGYFLQNNSVGGVLQGVPDPITLNVDPDGCLAVYQGVPIGSTSLFHVVWFNSTHGVNHIGYFQDFTIYQAQKQIDSSVSPLIRNITGIAYTASNGTETSDLFYEATASTQTNHYVKFAQVLSDGYGVASNVFQRAAGLASKPFRVKSHSSILVSYASTDTFQDTYFALGADGYQPVGAIEAKVFPQIAGVHTSNDSDVPNAWVNNNLQYIAVGQKTKIAVGSSSSYTPTGLSQASLNYASSALGPSAQLGQNLHLPGGYVKMYDSSAPVEHNFHLYPEQPTLTAQVAGSLSGTYEYAVVFEWRDSQNQTHQSEVSVPVNYTTPDGYGGVVLTLPTLRYTDKKPPLRTPVTIAVYRTTNLGTIFYKATTDTSPVYNDTTVDSVTFTDTLSDAALISRPELYTNGGVLNNAPAPACKVIINAQNRLFAGGLTNTNDLAFSKPFVVGQGVAFAPEQVITIDSRGGGITALAELDQNVVIFKETAIFLLTGTLPDVTGQNGSYTIQRVATDIGCTDPSSIVLTPNGLMFKSAKGIWLFDRSFKTSYIGANVEAYNDLTVTGAQVVPDLNQVRFSTMEGRSLVYDYYFNIWSTFTNQASVSATVWNDTYLFLRSSGKVWQEDRTSYADNGTPITTLIGTDWFSFASIQGYQRVERMQILGTYMGSHNLKVSVYYDFNDGESQVFTYNLSNNGYNSLWGDGYAWGSDNWGGSQPGNYQFYVQFRQQRCEAMRIVIQDYFPNSVGTAGFDLSAISFLMGVKRGLNRLPGTQAMVST